MSTIDTSAAINGLHARSIRLSEALIVYADVLPDLAPILRRELELVADKINEAASELRKIDYCHTAKLIRSGGEQ